MARTAKKLTAKTVASLTGNGRYSDGDGLYLDIDGARRRWVFIFTRGGKRREMGLGSARDVPLAEARRLAEQARQIVRSGADPIAAKKAERPTIPTFGNFADELIGTLERGFRNEKHRYQWRQTLGDGYCAVIRNKLVGEIATEDVLSVLTPVWLTKQETASRLRGRIEKVLDAAKAKGFIESPWENPARWRGHLANLLPARRKLTHGHQPAMAYEDVPAFVARLRLREAVAARALEFVILTAARVGEVLGATWAEIDTTTGVWTVPASRMKAGKEHRVPLTARAIAIIEEMAKLRLSTRPDAFVFPSTRPGRASRAEKPNAVESGRPMSNMAFKLLLGRMGETGFVPHGFRSSFRDWCGERTLYPREVAEAALAHVVGNEVERAYRRGDALEKRRALMDAWAQFIEPKGANVVVLGTRRP